MKIRNRAYNEHMPLAEIEVAMMLFLSENTHCTPTDILRLAKIEETNTTRTIVLEIALQKELDIEASGRGYRIFKNGKSK